MRRTRGTIKALWSSRAHQQGRLLFHSGRPLVQRGGDPRWQAAAAQEEEPLPPLIRAALLEEVEGRYRPALQMAKEARNTYKRLPRHQMLLLQNLIGVAELRLGYVHSGRRSLNVANSMAIAVGSVGRADDAYCDLAGVLNDLAVSKMIMGDLDDARNDLKRALYMAERAYRPDHDLVASIHSNRGELACLCGDWDEADRHHQQAVQLSDFIEHSARARLQANSSSLPQDERGGGGHQAGARPQEEEEKGDRHGSSDEPARVPPGLLGVYTRNIVRRLNLGRVRSRRAMETEGVIYLGQSLEDCRVLGRNAMQGHVVLYSQCLAAIATCHLASLRRQGRVTDVSHLEVGPDNEVTWGPQSLLEKALSVLAPVLGGDHYETWACRGNLALLLPLNLGLASVEELRGIVMDAAATADFTESAVKEATSGGGAARQGEESPNNEVASVYALTLAALEHNLRLFHRHSPSPSPSSSSPIACLSDLPPTGTQRQHRSLPSDPRLIWPVQAVLGVGLRLP